MFATLAVGSGIALAVTSFYQRLKHHKELSWVKPIHTYMHSALSPNEQKLELQTTQPAPVESTDAPVVWSEEDSLREILIIGLTSTTAIIHLMSGAPLAVLNGVGHAGLLAVHYLAPPQETYRQYTRSALFGYTGFTFVAYFVIKGVASFTDPIGIGDKLAELGLMGLLWQEGQIAKASGKVVVRTVREEAQQIPIVKGQETTDQGNRKLRNSIAEMPV